MFCTGFFSQKGVGPPPSLGAWTSFLPPCRLSLWAVHKNFKARKGAYEELQQLYAAGTPPPEDPLQAEPPEGTQVPPKLLWELFLCLGNLRMGALFWVFS